jgi:ribonucleoside-diphosphate reductase alpha chain
MPVYSKKGEYIADLKPKDVFDVACFASWCNGDPAFLFFDRINKDNPFYPKIIIDTVNPCSEVAMPHYSACCLGSINVSKFVWKNKFNFDRFYDVCKMGMRALTTMNNISVYPLKEITKTMKEYNPVGLGIMGFADCLIRLGILYDSQECLDFIDKIGAVYKEASLDYNADMFYFYRRIIAPTGSLSILADCSSGVEPVYDVAFERSLTIGKIEEVRDLYKSEFVRTAHQISPEWHIKVLAKWQEWIDGGVSKTVNLPNTASVDDVKDVYKKTWAAGCKGITVYRDGCREEQVLYSRPSTPTKFVGKCSDGECSL